MDFNFKKEYLTEQDLNNHPIWKRDEVDDFIYPVNRPDDFPDDSRNLYIRSIFTTRAGISFKGFIIGIKNICSIAIFCKNEIIYMNKNLYNDCLISIEKINKLTNQHLSLNDFSPLKFETKIDLDGFKNIQGEFNLSKPRTDEERLDF